MQHSGLANPADERRQASPPSQTADTADFGKDGQAFVLLEVVERSNGDFFYDADATSVEEIRAASSAPLADQTKSGAGGFSAALDERLAQWWNNVNPDTVFKVTDPETGEPLVVYHGGTVGNVFSTDYAGSGGGREGSFFFTPDMRQAKDYAGAGSVKAVFLDLKRPVETDAQLDPDEVAQAKANGNDGYWIIEDGLVDESEIAVFSPTQIKSATDNSGEFSPAEPSILRQPARGSFDPNTLTTILHQKADYSTFLHETGHFFLSVYADMASQEGASERIQKNMNILLDWFGVKDLNTWNAMTLDQQRKYNEKSLLVSEPECRLENVC